MTKLVETECGHCYGVGSFMLYRKGGAQYRRERCGVCAGSGVLPSDHPKATSEEENNRARMKQGRWPAWELCDD